MDSLWVNKWKPKNITDIIGHKNQIKRIHNWLKNIHESKKQAIIVSGNHGIGKTLTVRLILEELNYYPKIIYPNEIKLYRTFNDFSDYYNYKNSIFSKMKIHNSEHKSKLGVIFDETESITLTSEKKYVFDIFKENNKKKTFPLIFISNNQHSKLLNDLKKHCDEIRFYTPSSYETINLIKKI